LSVTTHIILVTPDVPADPQVWLGPVVSVMGASEIKSGSIKKRWTEKSLGAVSVEHIGEVYERGGLLYADLGGPPRLRELAEAFAAKIEAAVMGDFRLCNASLSIGKQNIPYLENQRFRTRKIGFQLSLWGYSSPKNDSLFIKEAAKTTAFKAFKAEIDSLAGPTEVAYMVYA
jgi:hypothetical protein